MRALIERGADVDAPGFRGATPLHRATTVETAVLLLASGSDLNAQDDERATPLHCAAREGNVILVEHFLDAGADPHARSSSGQTPSHCAQSDEIRELVAEHIASKALAPPPQPTANRLEIGTHSLLRVRPGTAQALSVSDHGGLVRWSLDMQPSIEAIADTGHASFSDIAILPDREQFAAAVTDGPIELRALESLQHTGVLELPESKHPATALAVSPDGAHLAAGWMRT